MAGRAGVLALQGAFREHCRALRDVGLDAVEVRVPSDLDGLDGLVIPGGESTTMSKLMQAYGLEEPILELHDVRFGFDGGDPVLRDTEYAYRDAAAAAEAGDTARFNTLFAKADALARTALARLDGDGSDSGDDGDDEDEEDEDDNGD